jgi:hypothetical protein
MDEINNPHDVDFRERFTRREIAQDFLRQHLPAGLLAVVDLESLEIRFIADQARIRNRGRPVQRRGRYRGRSSMSAPSPGMHRVSPWDTHSPDTR